jgi:uncharacterized membrane protein YfcA
MYEFILFLSSVVAGGVASVVGFGIGSILTPLLCLALTTNMAVAFVAVPHLFATGLRFWLIKSHIDRGLLLRFGLLSACGGIVGAYSQGFLATPILNLVFGVVLLFTGTIGVLGLSEKMRFSGVFSWIAGGVSGFFGGLIGNQGGIRAAAMLGQGISKEAFVATSTAVGLIVDLARIPIYLNLGLKGIGEYSGWLVLVTAGCLLGTFLGFRYLKKIPEQKFKRTVSGLIICLGIYMIFRSRLN